MPPPPLRFWDKSHREIADFYRQVMRKGRLIGDDDGCMNYLGIAGPIQPTFLVSEEFAQLVTERMLLGEFIEWETTPCHPMPGLVNLLIHQAWGTRALERRGFEKPHKT